MNHETISWSLEPKFSKTFVFHKLFFPKYVNLKKISVYSWMSEVKQWKNKIPTWSRYQIVLTFLWYSYPPLATGPNFISLSLLVVELWQFLFVMDWPEIRKSETPMPNILWLEQGRNTECCKVPGLQLLLFLSYWVKTNKVEGGCKISPCNFYERRN